MFIQARWLLALLGLTFFTLATSAIPRAESADKPAADGQETDQAKNPHLLPDAPPDQLLAGISLLHVKSRRPVGTTRQEMIAHTVQIQEAIIDAADRILNSAVADETQAAKALNEKMKSLTLEQRLDQPGATERIQQAIRERLNDPRAAVAAEARFADLKHQLDHLADRTPPERESLLDQMLQYFAANEATRDMVNSGMEIARRFEAVETGLGARAYRSLAELLAKSSDDKVREYADKFIGSARRAELPGQFIEINGTLVDGKPFDWASYRGKVVLVDFWATWCGPCIAELPNVKKNYELYHDRGFDVVGISLDDDRQQLEDFLAKEQIPWVTLFSDDPQATGWNHPLATYYGIMAIPTVLLVDQEGKVVNMRARGEVLGQELARLLGPPPADAPSEKQGG
jgi:thiol-disulfide isomerase/thioredoxin